MKVKVYKDGVVVREFALDNAMPGHRISAYNNSQLRIFEHIEPLTCTCVKFENAEWDAIRVTAE